MPNASRSCVGAIVALLAVADVSHASPLEDTTLGGAVFTGPAHPHATALYINPAALGLDSQGSHFYLASSLRLDQFHIERTRILDSSGASTKANTVDAITLSPGGTFAAHSVGSKVSAGVAIGVPMTEEFIHDKNELGYHVLGGHHRRLAWLTLAVSFRLTSRIIIGTGLSLTWTSLKLSFLRDTALQQGSDPNQNFEEPEAAERYDLDVQTQTQLATQNVAFSTGIVYQVAQDWWLGIGVQSPAGFRSALSLRGTVRITPAPGDRSGSDPDAPVEPVEAQAEVVYRLPQTLAIGLRGPIFSGYEFVAGARWQNYSRHDQFDMRFFGRNIPASSPEWYPFYRGLRDVFGFEVGLEGVPGGRARIGGRFRFESGATAEEALSPLQVAGANFTAVAGGEIRLFNNIVLTGSYGISFFPTTVVANSLFDPRDYTRCTASQLDIDECEAVAEGRAVPSAAGTYRRLSHAVRLSIRYDSF